MINQSYLALEAFKSNNYLFFTFCVDTHHKDEMQWRKMTILKS